MSQALRSPGSTLKPFIYGLGFEDGLIHPESQIDDKPIRFGSYAPENFDTTFQGAVHGAQGAAALAQRTGGRDARFRPGEPPHNAARPCRQPLCCRKVKSRASPWGSAASA